MKESLDRTLADLRRQEQERSAAGSQKSPELLQDKLKQALEILDSPSASIAEKHDAANSIIERCTWDRADATLSITYRVVL